jgi:hypothetical protein
MSLTSLDLTVSPAPIPGSSSQRDVKDTTGKTEEIPRDSLINDRSSSDSSMLTQSSRKQKDPARDISLQVLEKFSLVTRFARETTAQLFGGESRMYDHLDLDHGPVPRPIQDVAMLPVVAAPGKTVQDLLPPKATDEVGSFCLSRSDMRSGSLDQIASFSKCPYTTLSIHVLSYNE